MPGVHTASLLHVDFISGTYTIGLADVVNTPLNLHFLARFDKLYISSLCYYFLCVLGLQPPSRVNGTTDMKINGVLTADAV